MIQLIAAAAGLVAGLISSLIANGQHAEAQRVREKAAAQYGDEILPQLDQIVARQLPPETAQDYMRQTQATQSQSSALSGLQREVDFKGQTPEDKAATLRATNNAGMVESAGRGAVLRSLASRGMAGGGLEAALMSSNAQDAANTANMAEVENAANSRGRYLDALKSLGSAGSSVRGQELQSMAGRDSINRFNAQMGADADKYNAGLAQQQFTDKMALLNGRSNALNGVANGSDAAANRTATGGAAVGQGIVDIGSAYAAEQEAKKPKTTYDTDWKGWGG